MDTATEKIVTGFWMPMGFIALGIILGRLFVWLLDQIA